MSPCKNKQLSKTKVIIQSDNNSTDGENMMND